MRTKAEIVYKIVLGITLPNFIFHSIAKIRIINSNYSIKFIITDVSPTTNPFSLY